MPTSVKVSTRFFILKSLTVQDLEASVRKCSWVTQAKNEAALNDAFHEAETGQAGKRVPVRIDSTALTMEEVEAAFMQAKPDKAPGRDEITFRVWQELWPVVKDEVVRLYRASLELRYVPERWRTARIVVLRKPNKPDYWKAKAYRPISLLETVGKGLETVIARRLSYLAEAYRLLPENHFGGRPQRSGEQALNVLIEKIHEAWRGQRVLSLVSFDVQGAFNGVHTSVLCQRLCERRIPKDLVQWIESFCSNRKASVVVGEFESTVQDIEHAGVPQGSPLSPLLYVFYNANLVHGRFEKSGASIGFIDDYNAWVTGSSAEVNRQMLQSQLIPKVEGWARQSGAIFEAEKTSFIHFTRRPQAEGEMKGTLTFGGQRISPSATVKVLGVTLDSKLTMDEHIAQVASRAMGKCMALRKIRGVRPIQMRQLYMATVVPATDYAASTWYAPGRKGTKRLIDQFERVQRVASRLVLRAFKSVALLVLQSEARIPSVHDRLHRRVSRHMAKVCALPPDHPLQRCITSFRIQGSAFPSPLRAIYEMYRKVLEPRPDMRVSESPKWVMPPWQSLLRSTRSTNSEEAVLLCRSVRLYGGYIYYTAGVIENKRVGAAAIMKYRTTSGVVQQETIGRSSTCSILNAELTGIRSALQHARRTIRKSARVYVATASRDAFMTIRKGLHATVGRETLHTVADTILELESVGHRVSVFLIPDGRQISGLDEARAAAQAAASDNSEPALQPSERVRELSKVLRLVDRERSKRLQMKDDSCVK